MLNAAEAAIDASAEDDTERARNRARLYEPPVGQGRDAAGRRVRPRGRGLDMAGARELTARLAAEDARFAGERTS